MSGVLHSTFSVTEDYNEIFGPLLKCSIPSYNLCLNNNAFIITYSLHKWTCADYKFTHFMPLF